METSPKLRRRRSKTPGPGLGNGKSRGSDGHLEETRMRLRRERCEVRDEQLLALLVRGAERQARWGAQAVGRGCERPHRSVAVDSDELVLDVDRGVHAPEHVER